MTPPAGHQSGTATRSPRYRFGFVLSTGAGNLTRFLTLKKHAELDPEVACTWAPHPGFLEPDPFRGFPAALAKRMTTMRLARPVMSTLEKFDAVMFHAFEPYVLASLRAVVARRPVIVWSQDDPPTADPTFWEGYGLRDRSARRARLRFRLDTFCAHRARLLLPFSTWAATALTTDCGVPSDRVHALPVGIDVEFWGQSPCPPPAADGRLGLLFVGGDFHRKGGDLLLRVFRDSFADVARLDLVTRHSPAAPLPGQVAVHTDLGPNDPRLRQLYADASIVVLPTRADLSPNTILEAMATGRPVVASRLCGIPDMVDDGVTGFLIPPDDPVALADRLARLLGDSALRQRMGDAARARVRQRFSAATNVPRILALMKAAVHQSR